LINSFSINLLHFFAEYKNYTGDKVDVTQTTAMEIVLAKCVKDILMSINKLSYPYENYNGVMLGKGL
jgi:uncharacterized Fe-S cluster protein YjdI